MFPPSARAIVSARKGIEYLGVQNYTIYNFATYNTGYGGNRHWNPETDDGILNDQSTTCITGYNVGSCTCCGQDPYPPYECYSCEATYVYFNTASDFTLYNSLTGGFYHTSGNLNRTGWKYIQSKMSDQGTTWDAENCIYNNCAGGYGSQKQYIYNTHGGYFDNTSLAAAEGGIKFNGSIGIKYDNTLWAWGGSLWMSSMGWNAGYKYSPYQLGTDTWSGFAGTAGAVYNGTNTFLGIKTNGTLWAWGDNNGFGQLGNNSIADASSPVQIGTDTNWKYVQTDQAGTTAALKTDGTLWMWGYNGYGQLGQNNTTNRSSPVQVGTGTDWARVMTGYYTTLAIKTDGTLWGWGYNGYGSIGDNTTTNRSSPVQIGTGTNWSKIRVNYIAANAIKTDGTLWGWSYAGRYGLANTAIKSSPVQMGSGNSDHADFINDTINSENPITINTDKKMLQYYAFGSTTRYSAAVLAGPYYQTGDDFQLQKVAFSNNQGWVNILKSGKL